VGKYGYDVVELNRVFSSRSELFRKEVKTRLSRGGKEQSKQGVKKKQKKRKKKEMNIKNGLGQNN